MRTRLVLVTLASSSAGLVLAFAMFLLYDNHLLREHKEEELRSAADVIATNSTAALVFDDEEQGRKVLRGLQARVHIGHGLLYRADGTVLAEFVREGFANEIPEIGQAQSEQVAWKAEHLQLLQPIQFQGRRIGDARSA